MVDEDSINQINVTIKAKAAKKPKITTKNFGQKKRDAEKKKVRGKKGRGKKLAKKFAKKNKDISQWWDGKGNNCN